MIAQIDARSNRRAVVGANAGFTAGGLPKDLAWVGGGQPRFLFDAVCPKPAS